MTRNVWKNFRTILVWVIALIIFYIGDNQAYGEEWQSPESIYILVGFMVMGTYDVFVSPKCGDHCFPLSVILYFIPPPALIDVNEATGIVTYYWYKTQEQV